MKLIDADELSKEMYHEAFETDTDMQRWDSGCWIRYKLFENKIENAPTVDIDALKHDIEQRIRVCYEMQNGDMSGSNEYKYRAQGLQEAQDILNKYLEVIKE